MAKKTPTEATRSSARILSRKGADEPPVSKKAEPKPKVAKQPKHDDEPSAETEDEPVPSTHWKVGEKITPIELSDNNGESVNLLEAAEENGLVIFFYPKASTPGCTTQAQLFRDSFEKFQEHGYKIYGCSGDSVKSQNTFKTKQSMQFELLSDPKLELVGAVGAKSAGKIIRSHVVVGKGGVVLDIKIKVSPKDSAKEALEVIESQ